MVFHISLLFCCLALSMVNMDTMFDSMQNGNYRISSTPITACHSSFFYPDSKPPLFQFPPTLSQYNLCLSQLSLTHIPVPTHPYRCLDLPLSIFSPTPIADNTHSYISSHQPLSQFSPTAFATAFQIPPSPIAISDPIHLYSYLRSQTTLSLIPPTLSHIPPTPISVITQPLYIIIYTHIHIIYVYTYHHCEFIIFVQSCTTHFLCNLAYSVVPM